MKLAMGYAVLAALLMAGCSMAERRYNEARESGLQTIGLTCKSMTVERVGDDYRYVFLLANPDTEAFEGRVDIDLIAPDLVKYTTYTPLSTSVPARGARTVRFTTPTAPVGPENPNGYKHFVFRAYTHSEELLVRQLGEINVPQNR